MSSELGISRRVFLQSCSVLALALGGCAGASANARFAREMLRLPAPDEWRPVVRRLITCLLPLEDPRFPPLGLDRLEQTLMAHFDVEEPSFDTFRRALMVFEDVPSFPARIAALVDDEADQGTSQAGIERAVEADRAAFGSFTGARFSELPLPEGRAYLRLWATSGFTLRRRFYRSAKAMVMISTYSTRALWDAIGYEGPLLKGG